MLTIPNNVIDVAGMNLCTDASAPLFHISYENHDGEVFYPRVPQNRMVGEDGCTDRVCLADSLNGCYHGIQGPMITGLYDEDYVFVHVVNNLKELVDTDNLWLPGIDRVPDVVETGEIWATGPVELECICLARVFPSIYGLGFQPVMDCPPKISLWQMQQEFETERKYHIRSQDERFEQQLMDMADVFARMYTIEFTYEI